MALQQIHSQKGLGLKKKKKVHFLLSPFSIQVILCSGSGTGAATREGLMEAGAGSAGQLPAL